MLRNRDRGGGVGWLYVIKTTRRGITEVRGQGKTTQGAVAFAMCPVGEWPWKKNETSTHTPQRHCSKTPRIPLTQIKKRKRAEHTGEDKRGTLKGLFAEGPRKERIKRGTHSRWRKGEPDLRIKQTNGRYQEGKG